MACSNCNKPSCGCSGTYVVSKTCPPACSEVFNASCIVYTGVDLTCTDAISGLTSTVISRNDYLDTALTAIVNYICARFNPANLPSSVVVSGDDFVVVNASTVGYVTTYTVTLDPAGLPSASIVEGGDNVVVTGTGSAGDPYVVNSHESIVDVTPGTALSVSTSSTGPYENTYTIDIDSSLLPVTELQTGEGHILITPIPNTPNTGDTTYNLEVPEVQITSLDDKIDIVNTNSGYVAPYERTFTVDINEDNMGDYIMATAAGVLTQGGIIADPGSGITVGYNSMTQTITIGESIGVPFQWQTISDGVTSEIATSPNDTLRIVSDAIVDGISVSLASGPGANEATFTIVNEDRGSAQLTFLNVGCSNTSGTPGGTCTAGINEDTLNIVGGAEIDVTVPAPNTIQITNTITAVYSNFRGDNPLSLQAGSTTDTLEILGGESITTVGNNAGPGNNTLTIDFDGVTIGAGLSGSGTSIDPLVNAAPNVDQFLWLTFEGDTGGAIVATTTSDALTVAGGDGITTNTTGTTLTITADVQREVLDSTSNPTQLPYTGGAGVQAITHTLGETYVNVRCFDGLVDVTSTTGITMVNSTTFNIDSAGNITNILVLG